MDNTKLFLDATVAFPKVMGHERRAEIERFFAALCKLEGFMKSGEGVAAKSMLECDGGREFRCLSATGRDLYFTQRGFTSVLPGLVISPEVALRIWAGVMKEPEGLLVFVQRQLVAIAREVVPAETVEASKEV
ncbi:MAG: hypothetical protein WCJ29_04180 [bacterium]